jgi:hypothetical protein
VAYKLLSRITRPCWRDSTGSNRTGWTVACRICAAVFRASSSRTMIISMPRLARAAPRVNDRFGAELTPTTWTLAPGISLRKGSPITSFSKPVQPSDRSTTCLCEPGRSGFKASISALVISVDPAASSFRSSSNARSMFHVLAAGRARHQPPDVA